MLKRRGISDGLAPKAKKSYVVLVNPNVYKQLLLSKSK